MSDRRLIVTHHAPDLDAIAATWILKRFDSQHYADAKVAFINPGERISEHQLEEYSVDISLVTHVDTGLGKFDHHQPERANKNICAATLTYEYVCELHPELETDHALKEIVDFVNEIDHFQEIHWPDPSNPRYVMMIQEILRGLEASDMHDDESQLYFGLRCLNYIHQAMTNTCKAKQIIDERGVDFQIKSGACLALETSNEETIKEAQKMGYVLVVRKDENEGHIRIKSRPDSSIDLKNLAEKIKEIDQEGTWFYHPGGKMLLNGSKRHHNQISSPLSLKKIIKLVKDIYG